MESLRSFPRAAARELLLLGLDVGSTTTSLLLVQAELLKNCVTGRMELGAQQLQFSPEPVFTPFVGEELDEALLARLIDGWVEEAGLRPREIASGGAIVTGLAARSGNAGIVAKLVRERFDESLVATADDPALESWLAFLGNCLSLSRTHPDRPFLNFDIGGGTTNVALGSNANVSHVGCYYVGARHVRCVPGTYVIAGLTWFARQLFEDLGIAAEPGRELKAEEIACFVGYYVRILEALVSGAATDREFLQSPNARLHCQLPFVPGGDEWAGQKDLAGVERQFPVVTFSGGVGEVIYRLASGAGKPLATTAYGELGIDLARAILRSPILSKDLLHFIPERLGRATVHGMTVHNTELSGATCYLSDRGCLPLGDVPIVGRVGSGTTEEELVSLCRLIATFPRGGGLRLDPGDLDRRSLKQWGERLSAAFETAKIPTEVPVVLLLSQNCGKTLGNYITNWRRRARALIVLDEVAARSAEFLSIGRPREQSIPVSFYGMHPPPGDPRV